jgi:TM2 domain-containing membrane protein YozV
LGGLLRSLPGVFLMSGWYIRRGEKVVGPVDTDKLKELVAVGRLVPTDQLAKDAAGPWTPAARTSLFAKAPATNIAVAQSKPLAKQQSQPPVVGNLATTVQEPQTNANAGNNKVASAAKAGLGALSSAGGAVARSLAERSKRKHELKLAKIQAQALADSRRPAAPQAPPQPAYSAPPPQQSINVNVVQQVNIGGHKRWSRLVAMFLSFLIPGLGQLYKGQPINGLAWFLITVVGYVCFIIPGVVLHLLCILGAGMGDPYR